MMCGLTVADMLGNLHDDHVCHSKASDPVIAYFPNVTLPILPIWRPAM